MKKVFLPLLLGSSLALVACGGSDSGSSGDKQETTKQETTTSNECVKNGDTVEVTTTGCTYAIPNFNGGAKQTYQCSGGRVSGGGLSGQSITLNGLTFKCK